MKVLAVRLTTTDGALRGCCLAPCSLGVAAGMTLLVAATAVGLCGAGAAGAPRLLPLAEQGLQHTALDAVQGELRQLAGGALGPLVGAVEMAHAGLSLVRAPTDTVDQLHAVHAVVAQAARRLPAPTQRQRLRHA
jgi:hypothetical protein